MTSSSLELYPCQVGLMGLPRGAVANNAGEQRRLPAASRATVQRASRNLFGTPDRRAIAQVLEAEQLKQRLYVMERYNIDIDTLQSQTTNDSVGGGNIQQQQQQQQLEEVEQQTPLSPLPSLIMQELQQHELHLQKEKCNLSRVKAAEITPSSQPIGAQIRRTVGGNKTPTTSSDRTKPYAKQPLLTESFNLRKTSHFIGADIQSSTSPTKQQRRAEVLNLPKSMRASLIGEHSSSSSSHRATQTDLPLNAEASPPPPTSNASS